jgi:actin-related protein 8
VKPEVDVQPMDIDNVNPVPNPTDTALDVPIEVIDVEDESKPTVHSQPQPAPQAVQVAASSSSVGGYDIDIYFEASKLPMDVAIFNSARAAGGDEKIRKYLQAVLVVGGTALIPGMAHALESRYSIVRLL